MVSAGENDVAAAGSGPAHDPLAMALAHVARHYGHGISVDSLVSGLPLTEGRLSLTHLPLAAERADLAAKVVRAKPSALRNEDCPLLLVMKTGDVAILLGREGKSFRLQHAGQATPATIALNDLKRQATGDVVLLSPHPERIDHGASDERSGARDWLKAGFKGTSGALLTAIIATILVNVIALVMPMFTMNIYDRVIPNAALNTLWALSIGACIAIAFDFAVRTLRAEIIDITGRRVDIKLANALFGRLLGAKVNHRPQSSGVQAATLKDFESLREFFQSLTVTTLGDIPFAFLFLAAIYALAGPLVLVPLIVAPTTLLLCAIIQLRLKSLLADQHRDSLTRNAVATEVIIGLETLKALGAESWAAEKWERSMADGIRVSTRIRRYTNLASHIVVASQLLVTVLMVIHGVYLAIDGAITAGALIAGVMLAGRAMSPVGQVALLMTRISQTRIAFDSLKTMLEAEQERSAHAHFVRCDSIKGHIAFENASFAYGQDDAPALANVSCAVKAAERIGILGSVGSGKSTALRAIVNLVTPQQGRVFVDGLAASHIDPALLRRAVALVPQEVLLFRGSIRQNITIHCPFASDEEIIEALKLSGAHAFITRLPKGIDTILGERGQGLSGGQRQAIALARCFVGKPKVLLLDEPTGAMDGRSETAILSAIRHYADRHSATLLIVTHRPAVLDIVDRLMVFEAGRLLLDGPKASVLQALKAMSAKSASEKPSATSSVTVTASPSADGLEIAA
jgi:ATP-binding cassette, subfamily C, bacterial LapB